jgi:predicted membrane metal-binding protein
MNRSATHEDLGRGEEIRGSSDRSFGLVFAGFFLLIALWPALHRGRVQRWALVASAVFLVLSLVRPGTLAPLNRLWLRLSVLLQHIVSPVILAVLFFFTITPIGLVMRLFGKNPLRLGFDSKAATYWIERRPPGPAPDTMRRQF